MAAEINLGKRMSTYDITNDAFDPNENSTPNSHVYQNENSTPKSHEYQNAVSLKETLPVVPTFKAAGESNGRLNRGFDSGDDLKQNQRLYENESVPDQRVLQHKTSVPRKKVNAVYEPTKGGTSNMNPRFEQRPQFMPSVKQTQRKSLEESRTRVSFICSQVVLCVILLIAFLALVLVLLIMLGKIGPNAGCSCDNRETGSSLQTAGLTGLGTSSLILTEVKRLARNVTRAYQKVELRKRQIADLKDDLQKHQQEQASVNDSLRIWDEKLRANLNKVNSSWVQLKSNITLQREQLVHEIQAEHNIITRNIENANVTWKLKNDTLTNKVNDVTSKVSEATLNLSFINETQIGKYAAMQETIESLIANSNVVNLTRHQEMETLSRHVLADLMSINSSLYSVDAEIAKILKDVGNRVTAANITLLNIVDSARQALETEDTKLNDILLAVNSTITDKAKTKENQIGVTGLKGANGTIGPQGPKGDSGVSGPGNLSACTRHTKSPSKPVTLTISSIDNTKVLMSVSCSGLDEQVISRLIVTNNPPTQYECSCYEPSLTSNVACVMHYWLCDK